jgi:tetratricopeptide (TPR) repeat protein
LLISIGGQYSVSEHENPRGVRLLEEAYRLSRGLAQPSIRANAACALAGALVAAGDLARADLLFQEGLRELPHDPQFGSDRLACLLYGSEIAYENGDSDQAIDRAQTAERVLKESPTHTPGDELALFTQLADVYAGAGQFREAIAAFEQANVRMVNLGYGETQRAVRLFNDWALTLYSVGRPLEAEKTYRRAIGISRANQTEDTVPTVVLYNYSLVLRELGRLPEAADYANRAHAKALRAGDEMLIDRSVWQMARIYRDQGDFRHATATLTAVEPKLRHNLPAGHYAFAVFASDKALLAQAKGNLSVALQLADQAVALDEAAIKAGGQGVAYLPDLLVRRSAVEFKIGQQDQAAADAIRALDLLQKAAQPGTFSSKVGYAYLAFGRTLQSQGKHNEANAAFRSAAEHLQKTLGPDHPDTLSALQLSRITTPTSIAG